MSMSYSLTETFWKVKILTTFLSLAALGPCITNVFATRRKNFSQWHRSFQRKLRSHWLKFLRHVAITLIIQGPVRQNVSSILSPHIYVIFPLFLLYSLLSLIFFIISPLFSTIISRLPLSRSFHYIDVIIATMASQITSLKVVYSIVYSGADQRKHQSSVLLAFVWGIHRERWIPRTKGQWRVKCFHLMTSSCNTLVDISVAVVVVTLYATLYNHFTVIIIFSYHWSQMSRYMSIAHSC